MHIGQAMPPFGFYFLWNICFVSTIPLVLGVYNRSQTEKDPPTLGVMKPFCSMIHCPKLGWGCLVLLLSETLAHASTFLILFSVDLYEGQDSCVYA